MRFSDALALKKCWDDNPPENEILAVLAQAYTTWRPLSLRRPMTHEEHMADLERRWKSGHVLSPKQMFEAMGGKPIKRGDPVPGIGPIPGL
jgi:hypothetical protein